MGNKLIGHGETLIALINLYILKKLPNSIILSGPKGIGKSVLAKHFLNYILTQNEINTLKKSYKKKLISNVDRFNESITDLQLIFYNITINIYFH